MRFLYAEDDVLQQQEAAVLLREDDVVAATTKAQALARLAEGGFTGIVVDLVGMGGLSFVREVRRAYPELPMVVYTGLEPQDVGGLTLDPWMRVVIKGKDGGVLEARAALAEMGGH